MTVHAYESLKRGLQQYFDLMEPILPPPRPDLWLRDQPFVYVMDPNNPHFEVANIQLTPSTAHIEVKKATVLTFFPQDYDFLEERLHQVPQTDQHYFFTVDISDLPDDDETFPTPTRKRLNTSQPNQRHQPTHGHRRKDHRRGPRRASTGPRL